MDKHLNRRRFLEISASTAAITTLGEAFNALSPLTQQNALAATVSRGIHDTQPATNWEDAFVSGNGRYGIMVYGNPLNETVIFTDHKFEQPNGSLNVQPPKIAHLLPQVQTDLLAGNYSKAESEYPNGWQLHWTQPFHPGYEMLLTLPANGATSSYIRTTNFETGEVIVQWNDNLGSWIRKSFVSRADNVVVQSLTAPSNGKLHVSLQLSSALAGLPTGMVFTNRAYTDSSKHTFLNLRGQYTSSASNPGYEGVTWVVFSGGTQSISGTTLTISNANSILLLTQTDRYDTATQWNNNALQNALVTITPDYTTLLNRHVAIHQPIYDRVKVDFNASASDRALTTTALISKQRSSTTALNAALLEKLFDTGRYHFLSASGYLPTRLSALWIGAWGASWSDDFTTDANVNLQMAGGNIGDMPEAVQAYINMILKQLPNWQTNATNIMGTRGIMAPPRTDGTSGYLFHFGSGFPSEMWTAGADWLLYPLYEHYQTTGDTTFLHTLWPWLEQLAFFYEDFLKKTDSNGHYVFVPSYSPENKPASTGVPAAIDATMDIAAGKHALQTAIEVANLLGVEQGAGQGIQRWTALLAKLPPYRINSDKALAEWVWPSLTDNYNHRHVSHLYPAWPLHEINPEDTPTLMSPAKQALLLRGNDNSSAHGFLHRALAWARLKDGTQLSVNVLKIVVNNSIFRSLMTSHYPGLRVYNADASNTIPAIIMEMLTYSKPGVTELLPALPDYLTQGSISGVRGRNLVTVVNLSWNLSAKTVNATLRSDTTQKVTLINRRGISSITSSVPISPSSIGSFARVLSLQAGVSTTVSITF